MPEWRLRRTVDQEYTRRINISAHQQYVLHGTGPFIAEFLQLGVSHFDTLQQSRRQLGAGRCIVRCFALDLLCTGQRRRQRWQWRLCAEFGTVLCQQQIELRPRLSRQGRVIGDTGALMQQALQVFLGHGGCVGHGRKGVGHIQFQTGAGIEGLRDAVQARFRGRIQRCAAGSEFHDIDFVATAKQMTQQRKGRGDCLLEQVHKHLPDDGTDPELRIIEAAGDGQVEVDNAVAILQQ